MHPDITVLCEKKKGLTCLNRLVLIQSLALFAVTRARY